MDKCEPYPWFGYWGLPENRCGYRRVAERCAEGPWCWKASGLARASSYRRVYECRWVEDCYTSQRQWDRRQYEDDNVDLPSIGERFTAALDHVVGKHRASLKGAGRE